MPVPSTHPLYKCNTAQSGRPLLCVLLPSHNPRHATPHTDQRLQYLLLVDELVHQMQILGQSVGDAGVNALQTAAQEFCVGACLLLQLNDTKVSGGPWVRSHETSGKRVGQEVAQTSVTQSPVGACKEPLPSKKCAPHCPPHNQTACSSCAKGGSAFLMATLWHPLTNKAGHTEHMALF